MKTMLRRRRTHVEFALVVLPPRLTPGEESEVRFQVDVPHARCAAVDVFGHQSPSEQLTQEVW